MIKILIESETRINSFYEDNSLNPITTSDETEGFFATDLEINSYADFSSSDAKFNNWHYQLNKDIKIFNISQNEKILDTTHLKNLLQNINDPTVLFSDLITSISKPIYHIESEIIKIEIFQDLIKVVFKLNKYIIEGVKV